MFLRNLVTASIFTKHDSRKMELGQGISSQNVAQFGKTCLLTALDYQLFPKLK